MEKNQYSDDVRQHLSFIQGVISRMNSNSFSMKGWMMAIVSALCALYASDSGNQYGFVYFLIATFVVLVFWGLDAYYLKKERQYRDLYTHVLEEGFKTDYSMDVTSFKRSYLRAIFCSFSTTPLYIIIIFLLILAILLTC